MSRGCLEEHVDGLPECSFTELVTLGIIKGEQFTQLHREGHQVDDDARRDGDVVDSKMSSRNRFFEVVFLEFVRRHETPS